jgi:putative ABC transport system permease protein
MLRNYIKTAFRSLLKNKGFTAINILGLSIGLATCLLIIFYVVDELGYDRYNEHASLIYRIDADIKFGSNLFVGAVAPDPVGPILQKDYPEVQKAVRFRMRGPMLIRKGEQNISEHNVVFADSTLFDVFTLPVLSGDARTALTQPHTVVINESTAKKYFNSTDVVGKTLLVSDSVNYKITAVIKDVPHASHFHFDIFVAMAGLPESRQNMWLSNNFNTYILLRPGADPAKLQNQLKDLLRRNVGQQLQAMVNTSYDAFEKSGNYDKLTLMPLTQIHLHSNKDSEFDANGNILYVYIFSFTALIILIIACINFMNLSTARSANRAREIGVRKVLGSLKTNLIAQFLIESMLVSFIAMFIALLIARLAIPYFNDLSGKNISTDMFFSNWLLPALTALVLIVGLLAGSYPAFFLSGFRPIEVLKGKFNAGFKSSWLRSGLVVFQFFISITLIIGTLVIYRQLNYIQNRSLGYNRSNILIIYGTSSLGNQVKTFKDELLKINGVENATITGYLPTNGYNNSNPVFRDAIPDQKRAISTQNWSVDENYVPTLDIQMAAGRNFSSKLATDSNAVVINQTAAKLLGFADPVNKTVYELANLKIQKTKPYTIIGVVKDFNFNSLRENVTPLVLHLNVDKASIAVKIKGDNTAGVMLQISNKWHSFNPSLPFNSAFMDDNFNSMYLAETRLGNIFITFAGLAIFIACLGLFGLVSYASEQRTREIGIRKVLGASVKNIVTMLSTDFLKLVVISALVAFPVGWYLMHLWLRDFAYRINISWWIFALAGMLALAIALVTVSLQAVKAAVANPVKSLRSE